MLGGGGYIIALNVVHTGGPQNGKAEKKEHLLAFPEPRPPLQGAACPSV